MSGGGRGAAPLWAFGTSPEQREAPGFSLQNPKRPPERIAKKLSTGARKTGATDCGPWHGAWGNKTGNDHRNSKPVCGGEGEKIRGHEKWGLGWGSEDNEIKN